MSVNFISHEFRSELKKVRKKQKRLLSLSKVFAVVGIIFIFFSFAPAVWYNLAAKVDGFSVALFETAEKADAEEVAAKPIEEAWQPRLDTTLPLETTVVVPSIGVNTPIREAPDEKYEEALQQGVWRVPNFGTPYDRDLPMILVAHRFGYLKWSNLYRRHNSFYNLPKLKVGDTVEVYYRQRKYIYEIYGEGRGEDINDYSADLILYTCETLNSKIRIFKYAKLLKI